MNAPRLFPLRPSLLAAALLAWPLLAGAAEYRSVLEPAILYDTPSEQGKRMLIASPGTPVEVIVVLDKWTKVRDASGAITWIPNTSLSSKRTVMVTSTQATVRQRPEQNAPLAFEAAKQLVLEVSGEPNNGWLHVRHQDGVSGYIRVTEVWGL